MVRKSFMYVQHIIFIAIVISLYSCSTMKTSVQQSEIASVKQPKPSVKKASAPVRKKPSPVRKTIIPVKKELISMKQPDDSLKKESDSVRKTSIFIEKKIVPVKKKSISVQEGTKKNREKKIVGLDKKEKKEAYSDRLCIINEIASKEKEVKVVKKNNDTVKDENIFQYSFGYNFGDSSQEPDEIAQIILEKSSDNANKNENDKTADDLNKYDERAEAALIDETDWEFYETYSKRLGIPLDGTEDKELIMAIDDWLGTRYKWGGCSKYGVDCSCFVRSIYKEVYNIELSRSSSSIFYNDAIPIKKEDLQEGDIICFKTKRKRISHIGLYLKDDKFVHSSRSKGVNIDDLNRGYYRKIFFSGGRVIEKERVSLNISK